MLLIFLVFCVVLPTSLDCPFLIWPLLVFSIVYLHSDVTCLVSGNHSSGFESFQVNITIVYMELQ